MERIIPRVMARADGAEPAGGAPRGRSSGPRRRAWLLGILAALTLLLPAAIALGLLDPLLPAGSASRTRALYAAALYLALAWLVTGGVLLAPRRRRGLLAAGLGILAALAAFELLARATELPLGLPRLGNLGMFSRALHHRYPARATVRLGDVEGRPMVLRTNEDGLRTVWDRASFRARRPRIAVLGDSFVFGMGVPQGTEFPVLLERRLRDEPGLGDLAVLNAGIVSYSPFLERWLFEDVVRHYAPDLVLCVVDVTDVGDDLRYEAESLAEGGRPSFSLPTAEAERFRDRGPLWNLSAPLRSALALPLESAARLLGRGPEEGSYRYYSFDLELGGRRETNQYFLYRHPLELTRPYFERTLGNLVALADAVEASGAAFVAVVIPRFHHWNPAECPDNWEAGSYALDEPYQFEIFAFFEEARGRVDFPILDLLPAFRATDEFPLVLRADPHWNERGHAFVARTLAELLLESELLAPGAH